MYVGFAITETEEESGTWGTKLHINSEDAEV